MYVHDIRHFALLLCWMHVTDWSPVIMAELDSVAIRWVRQETAIHHIKKYIITFGPSKRA